MYVQDVALPSGRDKSKRTVRTQGYSSRCSVKSTHNERKDWSEDNTVKPEVVSGEFEKKVMFSIIHDIHLLILQMFYMKNNIVSLFLNFYVSVISLLNFVNIMWL